MDHKKNVNYVLSLKCSSQDHGFSAWTLKFGIILGGARKFMKVGFT